MNAPPKSTLTGGEFGVETLADHGDGRFELRLSGRIDAEGAALLVETLQSLLDRGARCAVLDFANVDFLSSSGVGSLIVSIGEYRDEGAEILLRSLSEGLHAVFEMLDLLDYIRIEGE